jgi:cytoskeletal protein CcmA (bactofilin family)
MANTKIFKILILSALFLLPLTAVRAADTKTGNSVYVAKDEIISGNLYAAGGTITVDGTISGDLIAAAQTINVNGRIEGDIIAAAQNLTINGDVGGNVRVAGNSVILNGKVSRNVNALGTNIIFGADSRIGWDAYLAGSNAEVRGIIDGGLSGQAGQVLISGKIGKDLNLKLTNGNLPQQLIIVPEAIINGNITYTAPNLANISDQAKIAGKIQQNTLATEESNIFLLWIWGKLFTIFSALTVGLVLIFIGKNITTKILDKMEESPLKMLVPGLIIMFILPPIALVLIFTIIGIPLALIIASWWLIMTYVARIFTAILVGQLVIKKISKKKDWPLIYSLILGVVVCWLIFAIPFIGWLLALVAIWIGLGGIWSFMSQQLGILKK